MSFEKNDAFGRWWSSANKKQRDQLLAAMGSSAGVVRHIASGRRPASVAMTAKLEQAMLAVDGIEPLTRADMRSECANCPFAQACRLVPAQGGAE